MIVIQKSKTAVTRSCDFASVTKEQLILSSKQHIQDVTKALKFFASMLNMAAKDHDVTKLTQIDQFHSDFLTGFKTTTWWDNHRKQERHHLGHADGVRDDVNLVDVIEYISDCVMAGKARTGVVFKIEIDSSVLSKAFQNTCKLLEAQVEVSDT